MHRYSNTLRAVQGTQAVVVVVVAAAVEVVAVQRDVSYVGGENSCQDA